MNPLRHFIVIGAINGFALGGGSVDRLVTVGFTSKLHCVDRRSGTVLWAHDLVETFGAAPMHFGYAASPLRVGDTTLTERKVMELDLDDPEVQRMVVQDRDVIIAKSSATMRRS